MPALAYGESSIIDGAAQDIKLPEVGQQMMPCPMQVKVPDIVILGQVPHAIPRSKKTKIIFKKTRKEELLIFREIR